MGKKFQKRHISVRFAVVRIPNGHKAIGACLGFCIYKALHKVIPESWYEKIQVEGSQCVFELIIFWICTLLIMITIQPQIYHALFAAGRTGGEIQTWN